jgi:hypothetical protein
MNEALLSRKRVERRAVCGCATLLIIFNTIGCERHSTAPQAPPEKSNVTTLIISKLDKSAETRVGKLTFADNSEPKLTVEGNSPDAEALRNAWQEMSQQKQLPMTTSSTSEVNGKKITEFGERLVPKGDKMYPKAVWNVLEKKYRFLVDSE